MAIGRTADSVVVICQTGVGRFYYKGVVFRTGYTARPLGVGTLANQLGTDVVWPKHGGPHRPRPAAFASCSAAAISSARAEGWP